MICLKLHLKAKNTFGWSPEPPEVSGGAPCWTDIDCIERVKYRRKTALLQAAEMVVIVKRLKMAGVPGSWAGYG